MRFTAQ